MTDDFSDMLHQDSFVRGGAPKQPGKSPAKPGQPAAKPLNSGKKKDFLDDYVPNTVGKMVDNVFGKLDNMVNDAADYLFSGNKPAKTGGLLQGDQFSKQAPPPLVPKTESFAPALSPLKSPAPIPTQPPTVPVVAAPQPVVAAPPPTKTPAIRQLTTLQGSRRPELITPVMPEARAHIQGPVISRTTSIAELELPLEILDDPDLPRYFDQMKLYEPQTVEGGMCNMSQYEAIHLLKRGHWKQAFKIKFEDLKHLELGIYPVEMARSRFNGMRPVYKALAPRFNSHAALLKAIEDDINYYLKTGKGSKKFHKFVYHVVAKAY